MKILYEEDPGSREEHDLLEDIMDGEERHDSSREKVKTEQKYYKNYVRTSRTAQKLIKAENEGFRAFFSTVAVFSCVVLIGMLLFTISFLPRYGFENPESAIVVKRYVEQGLEETGAINIVAGIILDYRAFDTLGESHVLFTALMCVTVLLLKDKKNMHTKEDDFHLIRDERYHELYRESIMRNVATVLLPCLFLYGAYVLLNGQNSPGGGFSGGTVMGSGLIICAAAFGFRSTDKVITRKTAGAVFLQLCQRLCFLYGIQRNRKSYSQGDARQYPERRTDPAAGHRSRAGGRMYDVRLLQPVQARQHRRR